MVLDKEERFFTSKKGPSLNISVCSIFCKPEEDEGSYSVSFEAFSPLRVLFSYKDIDSFGSGEGTPNGIF